MYKLARKFIFKYAAELFDPKMNSEELTNLIKDNVASLYKNFMSSKDDGNGRVHSLIMMGKAFALKAPKDDKNKLNIEKYINKIDLKFTEIVSTLEELNIMQLNKELISLVKLIEEVRIKVRDEIMLSSYGMFHERKKLAGTAEAVLHGFEQSLLRQLTYIDKGKTEAVDFPTINHFRFDQKELPDGQITSKRMPMTQTATKLQKLVMQFGPRYGIDTMEQWSKINHKDNLLAKELVSSFLGMLRGNGSVKYDLLTRVSDILNPKEVNLPFNIGNLPKRPPGK